ncbi:MAG TPA: DUF3105 domain-containing protein [Gaiellaceae bacterium]
MAKKKKSRVPPPPRTSQRPQKKAAGPQRRVESGSSRGVNMWFVALGAAIIVSVAAVGIALAMREGGAKANGPDGPCLRKTFPFQGRKHIQKLPEGFQYNSFPPTSGPHYPPGPKAPVVWNVYDTPLDEVAVVHNLEHGGVVVQYGSDVPPSVVQQIVNWYQPSPNGIVVAPLPDNVHAPRAPDASKNIYLTAWTHEMTCPRFDEGAFDRFRDDYRGPTGDAPEKFPLSALSPGRQ